MRSDKMIMIKCLSQKNISGAERKTQVHFLCTRLKLEQTQGIASQKPRISRVSKYIIQSCQTHWMHFHTHTSGSIVLINVQLETQGPKACCICPRHRLLVCLKFYVEQSSFSAFCDSWIYAFQCLLTENHSWIKKSGFYLLDYIRLHHDFGIVLLALA